MLISLPIFAGDMEDFVNAVMVNDLDACLSFSSGNVLDTQKKTISQDSLIQIFETIFTTGEITDIFISADNRTVQIIVKTEVGDKFNHSFYFWWSSSDLKYEKYIQS